MQRNPEIPPSKEYSGRYDVLVVGSGPIGATYARKCVDAGLHVLMIEMGAEESFSVQTQAVPKSSTSKVYVPGAHKMNQIAYQKNLSSYVHQVKGSLNTVSIPTKDFMMPTLDPLSAQDMIRPFRSEGRNPNQMASKNLPAEAVINCVGGMSTHWACCTPRLHMALECPKLDRNDQKNKQIWKQLYKQAEELIGVSDREFDNSIKHTLILKSLQNAYRVKNREFVPMKLACKRRVDSPNYVEWHATARILEDIYVQDISKRQRFKLLPNHLCVRLAITKLDKQNDSRDSVIIDAAEIKDLTSEKNMYIQAKVYVIAAGAVGTPQLLFNSGFSGSKNLKSLIPNLGCFMTEQPIAFCQVILKDALIKDVQSNPYHIEWWNKKWKEHSKKHPKDWIPIPLNDPEPQIMSPVTDNNPWHMQINRGACSHGEIPETLDGRLVVDLHCFGYVEPQVGNRLKFEEGIDDAYGMPQPTFHFKFSDSDKTRAHRMMADMCDVASELGGYLPGSEPQFLPLGTALSVAGTVRAGIQRDVSVADINCKVLGFDNLYVGGNGVIPNGIATSPTLTSMCYAIKSAESIISKLKKPIKEGRYNIVTKLGGGYMDNRSGSGSSNQNISVHTADSSVHQKWILDFLPNQGVYTIKPAGSSSSPLIGVKSSVEKGAHLVIGASGQKLNLVIERAGIWGTDGYYRIRVQERSLVFQVGDDASAGTFRPIRLGESNAKDGSLWSFLPA